MTTTPLQMRTLLDSLNSICEGTDSFYREKCDRFLGTGATRKAFTYLDNPGWVIKEAIAGGRWDGCEANRNEHLHYTIAKSMGLDEWFAPIAEISPDANYLVMAQCDYPVGFQSVPKQAPAFLEHMDNHPGNYGTLNGRMVLMDYNVFYYKKGFHALLRDCGQLVGVEWDPVEWGLVFDWPGNRT